MNHSDDGRPLPVCYAWHPEKPSPILDGHRLWGKASVRAMMHELDCGCGCHLEGSDEHTDLAASLTRIDTLGEFDGIEVASVRINIHDREQMAGTRGPGESHSEGQCEALLELTGRHMVRQSPCPLFTNPSPVATFGRDRKA